MGVIVNKDKDSSKLNERITADLRAKSASSSDIVETDYVESADYLRAYKKTNKFAWFWIGLVILATLSLVSIMVF